MHKATFLVLGLAGGTALGLFLADRMPVFASTADTYEVGDAPYQSLDDSNSAIWPDDLPAPVIDITLNPDPVSGHNLILTADGFTYTPLDTNGPNVAGTGHGHIFVNGQRIGRMYSPIHHLTDLPQGEVTVHVYLSGNDHRIWVANGQPLFVERTFSVE